MEKAKHKLRSSAPRYKSVDASGFVAQRQKVDVLASTHFPDMLEKVK